MKMGLMVMRLPKAIRRSREHRVTRAEAEMLDRTVVLKRLDSGKGRGVVARRDLPVGQLVGVLPGRIIPDKAHDRMAAVGRVSSRYCMETRDHAGNMYVVEPEDDYCLMPASRFLGSKGHFINEPAPGERLNAAWAHNNSYDPERIDCYTIKPVRKGQELLVHYGMQYERPYRAPSEAPKTVEYIAPDRRPKSVSEANEGAGF